MGVSDHFFARKCYNSASATVHVARKKRYEDLHLKKTPLLRPATDFKERRKCPTRTFTAGIHRVVKRYRHPNGIGATEPGRKGSIFRVMIYPYLSRRHELEARPSNERTDNVLRLAHGGEYPSE